MSEFVYCLCSAPVIEPLIICEVHTLSRATDQFGQRSGLSIHWAPASCGASTHNTHRAYRAHKAHKTLKQHKQHRPLIHIRMRRLQESSLGTRSGSERSLESLSADSGVRTPESQHLGTVLGSVLRSEEMAVCGETGEWCVWGRVWDVCSRIVKYF